MGKSSLMARTAKKLEAEGVRTATVDLTQIGGEKTSLTPESWYFGVVHEIHRQLRIPHPLRAWWQEQEGLPALQKLTRFLRDVVLESVSGKVAIFVDEIDSTIGLPFADDFFAAIRSCHNARATDSAFARLTFALFGVASPDQLIQDPARTPFNIGHGIDLTDFTLNEARLLAEGLHEDPAEAERRLERIFHWTGGHPYLTQALCAAAGEKKTDGTPEALSIRWLPISSSQSGRSVRRRISSMRVPGCPRRGHRSAGCWLSIYGSCAARRCRTNPPLHSSPSSSCRP
jgi:hypothetical protein